jgi:hypothetical protein
VTEGNDSYDGTSPVFIDGTIGPKLTIAGAEAIVKGAGDIVYVGPGTYYEKVTLTDSGVLGSPIQWIADPECLHCTGDFPGVVRWSAADSDDTQGTTPALDFGSVTYAEAWGFIFDGTYSTTKGTVHRTGGADLTCKVYDCIASGFSGIRNVWTARCLAMGATCFGSCYSENCIALGGASYGFGGWVDGSRNNLAIGCYIGFNQSAAWAITIYNCVAVACNIGFYGGAAADQLAALKCHVCYCPIGFQGMVITDCTRALCQVPYTACTGVTTESDVVVFPNFDLLKRALEPLPTDSLYEAGNATYVPTTTDLLNRTRVANTIDIGPYELASVSLAWSVASYYATPPSITMVGVGEKVIQISAEKDVEKTIKVWTKCSTGTTTMPQIILRGKSISAQTDTVGTANAWEQLTVTATPTINEVLELILKGREAAKIVYWSDFEVV